MISPIRATPSMTTADLANVINDLADQLESENRTRIMRDEDGTNRVLFGKAPNGEWLIAVTAKGVDVLEALPGGTNG